VLLWQINVQKQSSVIIGTLSKRIPFCFEKEIDILMKAALNSPIADGSFRRV
jgi:hypothetical protein